MIFNELAGERFRQINYNKLYVREMVKRGLPLTSPSRALDPAFCDQLVGDDIKQSGCAWVHGGLWEKRPQLWAGSYLDHGSKFRHLGVDFTAPVYTRISPGRRLNVLHIGSDHPAPYGWGGHIIARVTDTGYVVIIGHIKPCLNLGVGDDIKSGEDFAMIDVPATNGGWFAHTHWQVMHCNAWKKYRIDLNTLDGYCSEDEFPELKDKVFYDPIGTGVVALT